MTLRSQVLLGLALVVGAGCEGVFQAHVITVCPDCEDGAARGDGAGGDPRLVGGDLRQSGGDPVLAAVDPVQPAGDAMVYADTCTTTPCQPCVDRSDCPAGYGCFSGSCLRNLAFGRPVSTAGDEFTPGSQSRITDGVIAGPYWAAHGPEAAVIDLGANVSFDHLYVGPFGCGGRCFYEGAWNVTVSTAAAGPWLQLRGVVELFGAGTLVAGAGVSIEGGDDGYTVPVPDYQFYGFQVTPAVARYLRYDVTVGDDGTDANCDEIEVYDWP